MGDAGPIYVVPLDKSPQTLVYSFPTEGAGLPACRLAGGSNRGQDRSYKHILRG